MFKGLKMVAISRVQQLRVCNERLRLLDDLSTGIMGYVRKAGDLPGTAPTSKQGEYTTKKAIVKEARNTALRANAALREHERQHGCKPSC